MIILKRLDIISTYHRQHCVRSLTSYKIRTLQKKSFLNSHTGCLNDGFQNFILHLNDCLPPRLDADMLSITEISSDKGDGALYFLDDFSPAV